MKRRLILLLVVLCAALGMIYFIGGFTIANCWTFDGQTSQDIGAGARVSIRVDTNIKSVSFLGISFYVASHRPYDIVVGFYTETEAPALTKAILDSGTIQFRDGRKRKVIEPSGSATWFFTPRRTSNWTTNGLMYKDSLVAKGILTNMIERNETVVFNCRGRLENSAGKQSPFDVEWTFRPTKIVGVYPGWHFERPFDPP